jgi:hypothetical protein
MYNKECGKPDFMVFPVATLGSGRTAVSTQCSCEYDLLG